MFLSLIILIAIFAGTVAAISGFGIGSLLTPFLGLKLGTKLAVSAVAIPHFFGTAWRCWMLRKHINRQVLFSFGITSALAGLAGAFLHNLISSPAITFIFAIILIFAGLIGGTGLNDKLKFSGTIGWIAGAVSGGLGGLVGNQGGIRSAALLGFDLDKQAFVATATAIALFVDLARLPIYLIYEYQELSQIFPLIGVTTLCVLIGTLIGTFVLKDIQDKYFKRIVSGIILILGVIMLATTVH